MAGLRQTPADLATAAQLHLGLGNLAVQRSQWEGALEHFQQAVATARQAAHRELECRALANAAAAALRLGKFDDARDDNDRARLEADELPASYQQGAIWLRCAQTSWQLSRQQPAATAALRQQAQTTCQQVLQLAAKLEQPALGAEAACLLAETSPEADAVAALAFGRRAVFLSQTAQAPHLLYRAEWQLARLLDQQGQPDAALAAYRRAVATLASIRHDLLRTRAATGETFRETIGPLYFELADRLLRQAESEPDPVRQQVLLHEARDTVETLKNAELEDYFRDDCVNLAQQQVVTIERVDPHTAVIYLIPLPDRTELLVGLRDRLERITVPVGDRELFGVVHRFRQHLEQRATNQYRSEARQLDQWLIAPLRPLLAREPVETLVFVPQGALHTIPFGALHDGKRFLIEDFAVAVSPGLTLMRPRPLARRQVSLLAGGLSDAVADYPPLPHVLDEVKALQDGYRGASILLNANFVRPAIEHDLRNSRYQLVHFASHGEFSRNAGESYILTHDGRLTLDELEQLLLPTRYRGQPVELLTLSACQTAAGDDRAALGLAGIAVKAGARSALATLWYVQDESSALVVQEFYRQLRQPAVSRAAALRAAQRLVLQDARYQHPGYWSAFILIGNWL